MIVRSACLIAALAALVSPVRAGPDVAKPTHASLPVFERVLPLRSPRDVGDLAMIDHTGEPRRLADFAGAPALVFFGFTHCPQVCPATMQNLALLKAAKAKELAGVRVVLISVDGERDSPEVLKRFLERYSKDFVGLTAPAAEVRNLALRFSAPFFKDPPRDGEYLVQHSNRVYALDKQGRLRAEMYDASTEAIVGIAGALAAE